MISYLLCSFLLSGGMLIPGRAEQGGGGGLRGGEGASGGRSPLLIKSRNRASSLI